MSVIESSHPSLQLESTACRICGRDNWTGKHNHKLTARGIHEASHVRKGEAQYVKQENGSRTVVKIDGAAIAPATPSKPKTKGQHPNSFSAKVRDVIPQMPKRFTAIDVREKLNAAYSRMGLIGSALRNAAENGLIRNVGVIPTEQWRADGNKGGAPLQYERIDEIAVIPPAALQPSSPAPSIQQVVDAFAEEHHECEATDVLDNLQRTLVTLNLLIAIQKLTPAQALSLVGTIGALGQQTSKRR